MAAKNEFLRPRPARRTRNVLFDLSNLVIPVLVAVTGIILFSFTLNRLQAAGLGVIHGYIMGMILR
jgi:hypothetical protein